MTGPLERLDAGEYGDPDDHRPPHVAPPEESESGLDAETERRLLRKQAHSSQLLGIYHRARHAAKVQGGERP